MKHHCSVLISFLAVILVFPGYSNAQVKGEAEEVDVSMEESDRVIELSKQVHFLTHGGEDVIVLAGRYFVELW